MTIYQARYDHSSLDWDNGRLTPPSIHDRIIKPDHHITQSEKPFFPVFLASECGDAPFHLVRLRWKNTVMPPFPNF